MKRLIPLLAVAWLGAPPPSPSPSPPPPPAIGVVVHAVTTTDLARLATLGVRDLRITVYANMPLSAARATLDSVVNARYDVLAVVNGQPARWMPDSVAAYVRPLAAAYPTVTWQLGNEPDWALTSAASIGAAYAREVAQLPHVRLAPPGLASATPAAWMRAALAAGLGASGVLCIHAYGDPVAVAMTRMLAAVDSMGWRGPVWVTEAGYPNTDPAKQATELHDLLAVPGPARIYVYALWSDADHFGITAGPRRHMLPAFDSLQAELHR